MIADLRTLPPEAMYAMVAIDPLGNSEIVGTANTATRVKVERECVRDLDPAFVRVVVWMRESSGDFYRINVIFDRKTNVKPKGPRGPYKRRKVEVE